MKSFLFFPQPPPQSKFEKRKNLYYNKCRNKGAVPQGSEYQMIFTPISHLRGMLQHRASIPNNPYHDQHILEFTGYMEETVEIL
jgi:hypothetical protein